MYIELKKIDKNTLKVGDVVGVARKVGAGYISSFRLDGTYSFINLTKEHICPCKFESVDDALKDIDEKINSGEVIRYFELR